MSVGDKTEALRLVKLAEAMMVELAMSPSSLTPGLMEDAKDALFKAESIVPGIGAFHLACLNAYAGKYDLCRRWLERGLKQGTLPDRAHLASSAYFKKLHGEAWFERIIEGMK